MPTVHNWEQWDEVEEKVQNEQARQKTNIKNKSKQKKGNKSQALFFILHFSSLSKNSVIVYDFLCSSSIFNDSNNSGC